jgi:curved DNA-binding protein CbpA
MPASPYTTLGVESDASPEEIKFAYRKLARSTHPDVNPNSAARFRRVNAAYALLSDANRRVLFDRGTDLAVRKGWYRDTHCLVWTYLTWR